MNAQQLHKSAMEIAKKALDAKESGRLKDSVQLFKQSCEIESQAAFMLYAKIEAEPTRSVLFRSAASMALNCGDFEKAEKLIFAGLSGNPPTEIAFELRELNEKIIQSKQELISEESFSYIQLLRDKAINIRVVPKSHIHKEAVFINDVMNVLRNYKTSFANFIEVQFNKTFENDPSLINKLQSDFSLLLVNTKHRSFGASLSTDAVVMSQTNYLTKELEDWKRNLFDEYKKDVIFLDYKSQNELSFIEEKYSEDERRLIYKNIISMYRESSPYKISYTDKNFKETNNPLKPVENNTKQRLIPAYNQVDEEKNKELIRTYRLSSGGKSKKSDIISEEQMSYAELDIKIQELNFENETLYFNELIDVKIIYESGMFNIDFPAFGISITNKDHHDLLVSFEEKTIKKYFDLSSTTKSALSFDEREILNNFNNLLSMST